MPQVYPNSAVFLPPIIVIIICAITSIKSAPTPHEVLNDHKIDQHIQNIILSDNEYEPQGLTFDLNPDGQYVTRRKISAKSIFSPPGVIVCRKGQVVDPAGSGKCVIPFARPQTNWQSLLQHLNNMYSFVEANHSHLFTSSQSPERTTTFKRHVSKYPFATTTQVPDEKTTQMPYDEQTQIPDKEPTDSSLLITTTDNLDMQTTEVITVTTVNDQETTEGTTETETNETITSGDYSTVSYDDLTLPTSTTDFDERTDSSISSDNT